MIEAVCEMGIGRALFLHRGFLDVDNDAVVGAVAERHGVVKDIRGNRCILAGAGKIVVLRLQGHMIAYVVFSFHKASEE